MLAGKKNRIIYAKKTGRALFFNLLLLIEVFIIVLIFIFLLSIFDIIYHFLIYSCINDFYHDCPVDQTIRTSKMGSFSNFQIVEHNGIKAASDPGQSPPVHRVIHLTHLLTIDISGDQIPPAYDLKVYPLFS